MKHAIMISPTEFPKKNIGDYIQSIATRQFSVDPVFVSREKLRDYAGEPVKMIMNGWFMIHPDQFPPSVKIHPLYVSFHMNPANAEAMLADGGLEHLKMHEPIGCRDKGTVSILQKHGIKAFFTGCLTLTLGRTYQRKESQHSGVFFVDPSIRIPKWRMRSGLFSKVLPLFFQAVPWILLKPRVLFHIRSNIENISWVEKWDVCSRLRKWWCVLDFYRLYRTVFSDRVLREAVFIPQHVPQGSFANEMAKFSRADELLRLYEGAEMVVTGRIHAALPCTGMGTPVVFTNLEEQNSGLAANGGRLDGLLELLNVMDVGPGGSKVRFCLPRRQKIDVPEDIPIRCEWKPLADALAERCIEFMAEQSKGE